LTQSGDPFGPPLLYWCLFKKEKILHGGVGQIPNIHDRFLIVDVDV
jgi:hypothetical protein